MENDDQTISSTFDPQHFRLFMFLHVPELGFAFLSEEFMSKKWAGSTFRDEVQVKWMFDFCCLSKGAWSV